MSKGGNHGAKIVADAISKSQIAAVYMNVSQKCIMITEDRAYRCLEDWKRNLESKNEWLAPASLLSSLMLTFVSATFRDVFGISKYTWEAIFTLLMAGAAVWLLVALFRRKKTKSVQELMEQLMQGAVVETTVNHGHIINNMN